MHYHSGASGAEMLRSAYLLDSRLSLYKPVGEYGDTTIMSTPSCFLFRVRHQESAVADVSSTMVLGCQKGNAVNQDPWK